MFWRWRADRALLVLPFVFSPTFLSLRSLPSGLGSPLRRTASKRQVLHDRHVLTWKELLLRIDQDQIHSMLILCGATAGNFGAILRSSTLLEISAVCILDENGPSKATLDKAFRFSMLEQKSHWDTLVVPVPTGAVDDTQDETKFLSDLKERGVRLVGMVAAGAVSGAACDLWDLWVFFGVGW